VRVKKRKKKNNCSALLFQSLFIMKIINLLLGMTIFDII
jgi:hypothetical protein